MNDIECKVISIFNDFINCSMPQKINKSLSKRDFINGGISSNHDIKVTYTLWSTDLVRYNHGVYSIYISSETGNFWNNERIVSKTTQSRLNAFLSFYGFDPIIVRDNKKETSVKHCNQKLKINAWYDLDFANKILKKQCDILDHICITSLRHN